MQSTNHCKNAINATAICHNFQCFNCQELGHFAKGCKSPKSFLCNSAVTKIIVEIALLQSKK